MFSPQIRGFLYGILITTSLVSVVTYASTHSDGVFGEYFERMTGFCDETNGEILTGLAKTADGEPFATKRCTSIKDLLANVFGLLGGAPDGQAMLGFDVDGEPIYGDVNWHNDGTNITYTGGNVGIGTTSPAYKIYGVCI